jgi:superfamily II DNA/RNA helicase
MVWLLQLILLNLSAAFSPVGLRRAFVSPREKRALSRSRCTLQQQTNNNDDNPIGLNELQTLLRLAVLQQDYVQAGTLSDEIAVRLQHKDGPPANEEEKRQRRKRMSWRGLGASPWLVDRLDALNYTFPTTIQISALEAVNAILNTTDYDVVESTSLEQRIDQSSMDMGIVISGTTGSGKSLAFLVPLLSTLSDSLFTRQRIRVGAEESVGDATGDLLDRVAIATSPVVRTNTRRPTRPASTIATGASLSTLGKSGKDVRSPLALIVVPTRELGVQTAMLLYELVGGSLKKEATDLRGKANMFKYKGPKGMRIGCVLDDEEAEFGLKLQTDVAITTPQYLTKLIADQDIVPSKLRVVVYDEADLALEETDAKDLATLFDDNPEEREYSRLSFLVGASVTESLGNLAVRSRVLPGGKSYIATATRYAPLSAERDSESGDENPDPSFIVGNQPKAASLKDLGVCLDPGLRHERVRAGNETGLMVLARLLRKELKDFEERQRGEADVQRPRVVVFFPDEAMAKASIESVRDAMWGDHKVCVLLPKTGVKPLQMMEQFKNNETTVMLATPNSVRGLDFPSLTHVYTLYLPMDDPREYVHLAGRVGRVGQLGSVRGGGGRVVSILKEEEAGKMEQLAKELGFEFTDVELAPNMFFDRIKDGEVDFENADVEKMRRYLEDTMSLLKLAEDAKVDANARPVDSPIVVNYNDDYDEDEEHFQ